MEYVRVCDMYGTGFYYIPGTETCLRSAATSVTTSASATCSACRTSSTSRIFSTAIIEHQRHLLQARPLPAPCRRPHRNRARHPARLCGDQLQLGRPINAGVTLTSTAMACRRRHHSTTTADASSGIDHAYIELGGFRIGKTDSLFSTFTGYAARRHRTTVSFRYGPFDTHQIAYTFNAGNGFTAAVALEEGAAAMALTTSSTTRSTLCPACRRRRRLHRRLGWRVGCRRLRLGLGRVRRQGSRRLQRYRCHLPLRDGRLGQQQ